MANNIMLEILDGFSSVLTVMYRHSKSAFWRVTLNIEFE